MDQRTNIVAATVRLFEIAFGKWPWHWKEFVVISCVGQEEETLVFDEFGML